MWISLFVSSFLYIPMFLWGRGNITIGDKFWDFKIHKRQKIYDPHDLRRHALAMIAYVTRVVLKAVHANYTAPTSYPILYGMQILPLSVIRWIGFLQENHGDRKNHIQPGAVISSAVIYNLSGITNVILFLSTRQGLLLFETDVEDLELKVRCSDSIAGDCGGNKIEVEGDMSHDVDSIEGHRDDWQEYMGRHES